MLQPTKRRFTVAEYYRMAESGILTEDDRVELIDGEIVEMTPIGPRHTSGVYRLSDLFNDRLRDRALVGNQSPIHLSEHSEPEPDLTLLRRRPDFYASGHPTPEDIFLVVEVADTSAEWDRQVKVPLYARHGIPELWLVDVTQGTITVYREPGPGGYRIARVVRHGESLAPAAFSDQELSVADILG